MNREGDFHPVAVINEQLPSPPPGRVPSYLTVITHINGRGGVRGLIGPICEAGTVSMDTW